LVAEVVYDLQIYQDKNSCSSDKLIVMGKMNRTDNANILWGIEQYTLRLWDERKLDFVCVDYDPDCEIVSDKGFYLTMLSVTNSESSPMRYGCENLWLVLET
jgi:hypothetical protein